MNDAAALDAELYGICKRITTTESLMRRSQDNAQPRGAGNLQIEVTPNGKPFASLCEQLQAVVNASRPKFKEMNFCPRLPSNQQLFPILHLNMEVNAKCSYYARTKTD